MKVGPLFFVVPVLVLGMLHSRVAMAQQTLLKIQLGSFISVKFVSDSNYFLSGEVKTVARDSLIVTALGAFELWINKKYPDIDFISEDNRTENRNYLFLQKAPFPNEGSNESIKVRKEIKLSLNNQVNGSFVTITAL